jgi:peptidoglycan DL-endopeptidase RipA
MGRHAAPAIERRPRKEARPAAAPVRRSTFTEVEQGTSHHKHVRRAAYAALSAPLPAPAAARTVVPVSMSRRGAKADHAAAQLAAAQKANRMRTIKRLSHVLAPVLAITSGLTVALPANAASLDSIGSTAGTTVITTPTLVVNFGVSVAQAKAAVVDDLTAGGDRAKIVSTALEYLGDPYVEGGASHSGIDCSGLVMVAYQSVGINLVHYVPSQDAAATTIPESEAQPGDLVVYDNEEHIGLYLGDGLVLQAPHPGEPVDIIPMFSAAHHFARVLPAGS